MSPAPLAPPQGNWKWEIGNGDYTQLGRFRLPISGCALPLHTRLHPVLGEGARPGVCGEDFVEGGVGDRLVGGEGVFDGVGDVEEADVAGEEVLDGDLVCGGEDSGAGAAAAAGLEGQRQAGELFHVWNSEVQCSDPFQVQS